MGWVEGCSKTRGGDGGTTPESSPLRPLASSPLHRVEGGESVVFTIILAKKSLLPHSVGKGTGVGDTLVDSSTNFPIFGKI